MGEKVRKFLFLVCFFVFKIFSGPITPALCSYVKIRTAEKTTSLQEFVRKREPLVYGYSSLFEIINTDNQKLALPPRDIFPWAPRVEPNKKGLIPWAYLYEKNSEEGSKCWYLGYGWQQNADVFFRPIVHGYSRFAQFIYPKKMNPITTAFIQTFKEDIDKFTLIRMGPEGVSSCPAPLFLTLRELPDLCEERQGVAFYNIIVLLKNGASQRQFSLKNDSTYNSITKIEGDSFLEELAKLHSHNRSDIKFFALELAKALYKDNLIVFPEKENSSDQIEALKAAVNPRRLFDDV